MIKYEKGSTMRLNMIILDQYKPIRNPIETDFFKIFYALLENGIYLIRNYCSSFWSNDSRGHL